MQNLANETGLRGSPYIWTDGPPSRRVEGAMIPAKKIIGALAFYFAFCLLVS
jgi:hypothetical protein